MHDRHAAFVTIPSLRLCVQGVPDPLKSPLAFRAGCPRADLATTGYVGSPLAGYLEASRLIMAMSLAEFGSDGPPRRSVPNPNPRAPPWTSPHLVALQGAHGMMEPIPSTEPPEADGMRGSVDREWGFRTTSTRQ